MFTIFSPFKSARPADPPLKSVQSDKLYYYDRSSHQWSRMDGKIASENRFHPNDDFITLDIASWNVEFNTPCPPERLDAIISLFPTLLAIESTIVLLQEVHSKCFDVILSHPIVQAHYCISNVDPGCWPRACYYGTISLVPRSLASFVTNVTRMAYPNSIMSRDVLFIDLELPATDLSSHNKHSSGRLIQLRIANTHLESLPGHGDRARPQQLALVSQHLTPSETLDIGILAGDMNPISPSDLTSAEDVGFIDCWDACTHNRILDDGPGFTDGHTWGYQPGMEYPPRRMDKILFRKREGLKAEVTAFHRLGVGLTLPMQRDEEDEPLYLSDHYGILSSFRISRTL